MNPDTGLHANYGSSGFIGPKYNVEDDRVPMLGAENEMPSVHSSGADKYRTGANNFISRSAHATSAPRVLGQTVAYLTRKFPPLSNKSGGKFTRLEQFDPRAVHGGMLEVEGNSMRLSGWTHCKWILIVSILTVSTCPTDKSAI
jgi:hypothetical protein